MPTVSTVNPLYLQSVHNGQSTVCTVCVLVKDIQYSAVGSTEGRKESTTAACSERWASSSARAISRRPKKATRTLSPIRGSRLSRYHYHHCQNTPMGVMGVAKLLLPPLPHTFRCGSGRHYWWEEKRKTWPQTL